MKNKPIDNLEKIAADLLTGIDNFDHRSSASGIEGAIEDVNDFHLCIPDQSVQDVGDAPPALTSSKFRWNLVKEEVDELEAALEAGDISEVADAYADIIYIVLGSAIMHIGKDRFCRVWDEVQRSNMAKCTGGKLIMREDGKVLKPDGWTPPDIKKAFEG